MILILSTFPRIITDPADLARLCDAIRAQGSVALDTEFVWEKTYHPNLATVQAALPDGTCTIVDVLAVTDLSPLGDILADASVQKLLHDAVQDLMILARVTGKYPRSVFDVRYAAGFCGRVSTLSLQNLVREFTGVELAKTETRTNWIQRPLTDSQVEYALDDVRYLHTIRDAELAFLGSSPQRDWLMADMARLDDSSHYDEPGLLSRFYKTKGIGRMRGKELSVAWTLVAWRDAAARARNLPREFILPEKVLLECARLRPVNEAQVFLVAGMPPGLARRHGADIVAAVDRGEHLPSHEQPIPRDQPDEFFVDAERIERVLAAMRSLTPQDNIDTAIVASKAHLVCFLRAEPERREKSPLASGWRFERYGAKLELL